MKKPYKNGFMIALSAVIVLSGAAGAVAFASQVNGNSIFATASSEVSRAEISAEYWTGEYFTAPEATVSYKDKALKATAELVYPSGKTKIASSCLLDEAGLYTVVYTGVYNGFSVQETREFKAVRHLYESDGKVKPTFGAPTDVPDRHGIMVRLKKGETFKYNRVIDFNSLTAADSLIKLYVTPKNVGKADARQIIYKFTDTEDENNVLTITQQSHSAYVDWAMQYSYVRAGATGQPQSGWEGSKLHSGDKWGTPVVFSLNGTPASGNYKTQTFALQFDYRNLTLKTNNGNTTVICLKDPAAFDLFWTGFKKGTAYLSISCGLYNENSSNFVITDIAGQPLSEGDTVKITDETAPEIIVDCDEVPAAVVGAPYRLFDFTAVDDADKRLKLDRRVFMNYGSNTQSECETENGFFVPARAGEYVIEYTATDGFGNKAVKLITVIAKPRDREFLLELDKTLKTVKTGEYVRLNDYSVVGAIGGYEVSAKASCTYNGKTYDADVTGGGFRPEYDGEWTITVTATDYISSVSNSYKIIAERGNAIEILEEAVLPEYMIKGATYKLPEIHATDYSGGSPVPTKTAIRSASGSVTGRFFVPETAGDGVISYYVEKNGAKAEKNYTVKIIDVGYGDKLRMQNYFYGDKVTTSAHSGHVEISASENAVFDFIKSVDRSFELTLSVNPLKRSFERLKITVADENGTGEEISLIFHKNKAGYRSGVSVNGGAIQQTEGSFTEESSSWQIAYDASSEELKVGAYVKQSLKGKNLFPSGKVKISFEFDGVTGESAVRVEKVNNQAVSDSVRDVVRPQISLLGSLNACYSVGDTVVLPLAVVADVLDPTVALSISGTDPSGNAVWSETGVELNLADGSRAYAFKVEKRGQYNFTVTATDTSNRRQFTYYAVNVTDVIAPEIIMNGKMPAEAKVGEKISVPKFSATDDSLEPITVFTYLTRPDGVMVLLYTQEKDKDGKRLYNDDGTPKITYYHGFTANVAGDYTVYAYATDKSGNVTLKSWLITVK